MKFFDEETKEYQSMEPVYTDDEDSNYTSDSSDDQEFKSKSLMYDYDNELQELKSLNQHLELESKKIIKGLEIKDKARTEFLKRLNVQILNKQCQLGICEPEIQEAYNKLQSLNEKSDTVKGKNKFLITISLDDSKIINKKGINYKKLIELSKTILCFKWVQSSNLDNLYIQLEQRSLPDEDIKGIHYHIKLDQTNISKSRIIKAIGEGTFKHFISGKNMINVKKIGKNDNTDKYFGVLKIDDEKRKKQVRDRELQLRYNYELSELKEDPMLYSLVVPKQQI